MIVGIFGPGGEGGTFLDWSLHYLVGDRYVKWIELDRTTKTFLKISNRVLLKNPIKPDGTAHYHRKTHPTEELIQKCVDELNLIHDENINMHTMYIVSGRASYEGRSYTKIINDIAETYTELKLIHFIFPDKFNEDLAHRMYTKSPNQILSIDHIRNKVKKESLNDNKIVDKLNVYPLLMNKMFYNLDSEIYKIFDWLSLSVNDDKYNSWLEVYKQWQLAQNFYTTIGD